MDYKAGMFVYALAFLLGVVFVQQLPLLPSFSPAFSFLTLVLVIHAVLYVASVKQPNRSGFKVYLTLTIVYILLIINGIIYTINFANQKLSYRLDEQLIARSIVVKGWVSGIPVTSGNVQRFEFNIDHYRVVTSQSELSKYPLKPVKIRLSWYYGQQVNAGEYWQLEVRLKPPHGFINPGGFDYEAWLFQHGLHANGYVRKSTFNKPLPDTANGFPTIAVAGIVDSYRHALSRQIDAISTAITDSQSLSDKSSSMFALIKALAIGDKSSISKQQWQVLASTGTSHLMAISGLHIGLAAFFAYIVIRRLLPEWIMKRLPAQHVALVAGMLLALSYAMLAGLSVPTQRAIIMLFVLSMMLLIRRNHRPTDALGFALLVVLLFDPLSVLSAGFWFSFSAVAVIFISMRPTSPAGIQSPVKAKLSTASRLYSQVKQWLLRWLQLQLLISLFLLPLSLFMFQQVSLVSPLANLILIPFVSFLVVPVILLAIVCAGLFPAIAEMLFNLAAFLLDLIWPFLRFLHELPFALWVQGEMDLLRMMLVTGGMIILYFSRQLSRFAVTRFSLKLTDTVPVWGTRSVACLMLMPLFVSQEPWLKEAEYQLTVLDVGQGSAAVIQTSHHVAVFDTGAKFSDKLDSGRNIVIPYLRSQGVDRLDRLIISHGDADHIGGAQAIIDEYPDVKVIGQDLAPLDANNKQRCAQGIKWQWDSVYFEFLAPPLKNPLLASTGKRNDHSCVLRVSSTAGSVLFTGDIEKKAEQHLLENNSHRLAAEVLMVPHHGSKTSSSAAFIAAVNPVIAVFSAGYRNRYQLPNSKIIQRYQSAERQLVSTAKSGAITIKMLQRQPITIEKHRETARKYWHHQLN